MVQIFPSTVPSGGNPVERLAVLRLLECGFACGRFQVACMNELGNVVAGGQTNMNSMLCPGASIIVFEPLSQCMSGNADNRVHLWVKRFGSPESVHRDAVFLDFVDGSFEIFFANKCQQSSRVVRPPEYAGRQDVVYFSPFGLKFANRRLQVSTLENGPSTYHPIVEVSITEFSSARHQAKRL